MTPRVLVPTLILLIIVFPLRSQEKYTGPIIDMHLHDYTKERYFQAPAPDGTMSPESLEDYHKEMLRLIAKHNIVKAVTSPPLGLLEMKKEVIVPGYQAHAPPKDTIAFLDMIKSGKMKVFGEIGAVYDGYTLSHPDFEPFLDICERYDVPVAIHTGGGPPRIAYMCCPNFRMQLGDPFEIEDVLIKYPKLRIYMMHAGEVFYEHALRLMKMYPQLYVDLGVLLWVDPITQDYAESFLRKAKNYNLVDRVLYGTDQMVWPHAIEISINTLNSYDFLSLEDKRKIFYENAIQFMNWDTKDLEP
ncbi:amidohydrolase family protein [Flagellimonas sp. S174]|uniref:amidohydrolase family protein n=1 Tax=Flagellimonas sp. S174 TaxID=3410790 RepID=UPI003BF617CB